MQIAFTIRLYVVSQPANSVLRRQHLLILFRVEALLKQQKFRRSHSRTSLNSKTFAIDCLRVLLELLQVLWHLAANTPNLQGRNRISGFHTAAAMRFEGWDGLSRLLINDPPP